MTAGAGPGGAALPVPLAAALVVLARAITTPASAIVIRTEMR